MVSTGEIDRLEMGWVRKKTKSERFKVENFNGSFEQKQAFYYMWNEELGTKKRN